MKELQFGKILKILGNTCEEVENASLSDFFKIINNSKLSSDGSVMVTVWDMKNESVNIKDVISEEVANHIAEISHITRYDTFVTKDILSRYMLYAGNLENYGNSEKVHVYTFTADQCDIEETLIVIYFLE